VAGTRPAGPGDVDGAIEDFREALKWHPGWWVAENELPIWASHLELFDYISIPNLMGIF
jgi:hypothetical protein